MHSIFWGGLISTVSYGRLTPLQPNFWSNGWWSYSRRPVGLQCLVFGRRYPRWLLHGNNSQWFRDFSRVDQKYWLGGQYSLTSKGSTHINSAWIVCTSIAPDVHMCVSSPAIDTCQVSFPISCYTYVGWKNSMKSVYHQIQFSNQI